MTERCMCGSLDCSNCYPSQRSRKLADAISSEEYAEKGYGYCPVCRGWQLDGSVADFDGKHVTQRVSCECGATWTDLYVLEGYIDLDVSY